jgi:two-component system sensor histidine kinase KdpD
MTRLEAGALEVKRSWHSLEEIVGAALRRIEPLLGGRPIRVEVDRDLPLLAVDDVLVEQVIFNLIENASKHAPSSEPIEIRARTEGEDVVVSVGDRGPGLPAGAGEQVFEKFYRGEESRGTVGVGLGLAVCRGIVEAHGGRIRALDRPGGGALFVFTLPLSAEAPSIEAETPVAAEPPRTGVAP